MLLYFFLCFYKTSKVVITGNLSHTIVVEIEQVNVFRAHGKYSECLLNLKNQYHIIPLH